MTEANINPAREPSSTPSTVLSSGAPPENPSLLQLLIHETMSKVSEAQTSMENQLETCRDAHKFLGSAQQAFNDRIRDTKKANDDLEKHSREANNLADRVRRAARIKQSC